MITDMDIKDSGERRHFDTGSQRDTSEGKGRFDLLQWMAIIGVAKVMEAGANKYNERNWELGQAMSVYLSSAIRHLLKWCLNWKDEPHLEQCIWNLLCMLETRERIRIGILPDSLNDCPSVFLKSIPNSHIIMSYLFEKIGGDHEK